MTSYDNTRPQLRLLSQREICVLMRLRDGWRNRQIADDLGIAESTVKTHISALFRKLEVQSRTEAAVMAQRLLFSGAAPAKPAQAVIQAHPLHNQGISDGDLAG